MAFLLKFQQHQIPTPVTVTTRLNGTSLNNNSSLQFEIRDRNYHIITNSIFAGYFFSAAIPDIIEMVISADKVVDYTYTNAYLGVYLINVQSELLTTYIDA